MAGGRKEGREGEKKREGGRKGGRKKKGLGGREGEGRRKEGSVGGRKERRRDEGRVLCFCHLLKCACMYVHKHVSNVHVCTEYHALKAGLKLTI